MKWTSIMATRWVVIGIKTLLSLAIVLAMLVVVSSVSLVYDFTPPQPFSGPDIYDPYRNVDTTLGWRRAALHTHSRVEGILNECDFTPKQIVERYRELGYEVVHFSNHNEHTEHPTEGHVAIYEHGYNIAKLHMNVYGSDDVMLYDPIIPIFDSQRQFKLDLLSDGADLVQLNHPGRTIGIDKQTLQRIGGYRVMELSRIIEKNQEEWDWALSAGRYVFAVYTDDMHFLDRSSAVAIRSTVLNAPSESYEDVVATLNDGAYYSLYTPDYGGGDWDVKREMNLSVPGIRTVGESDGEIYVTLTESADSICFTGQNQRVLHTAYQCDSASYVMANEDSYARITAYFADGERIYTNAFARYDATTMDSPFDKEYHSVNVWLTILYNLMLLAMLMALAVALYKVLRRWENCKS